VYPHGYLLGENKLSARGVLKLWIPGFSETAKPLYASTSGRNAPLEWTETTQLAFEKLKQALVSAPALALPDIQNQGA
jgi:hypothetical protein